MQVVREITEEEEDSDVEYTTFEAEENSGSVQHLQKEVQAEVFAALHLRSVEEDSPKHKCSCCLKCTKITVMVALVVFIWMAISVPSIIFGYAFLSRRSNSSASTNSSPSNYSSSVIYTGKACRPQLSRLQVCLYQKTVSNSSDICIPSNVDQQHQESTASLLLQSSGIASEACLRELLPFACLYLFPLVVCEGDGGIDSKVHGPTQQNCERIRDVVCEKEWKLFKQYLPKEIPDCGSLKYSVDLLVPECIDNNQTSNCNQTRCTTGFECFNGSCRPVCQIWSPYSKETIQVTDILVISASLFALVVSIAVLVLGCCRCRKIYSYPSIFIIYQTVPLMALAVLVLIGYAGRQKLFCRHRDLMAAFANPSPFCIVTGIAFHYFITQLPFWWLCHVITVFLSTLFPYQMRRIECTQRLRCLHALMVAAGILLPMGSVAAVAASGGFTLTRLPTYLCVGDKKVIIFFAVIVPICIAIAIGSSLMIFILSTVIKRHIQAHVHQLRVRLDWTAEAKVFIVLFYYLILGVVVVTILTRALTNLDDFFKEATEYFGCEAKGIPVSPANVTSIYDDDEPYAREMYDDSQNATSCNRSGVDRFSDATSTTIAFVLLGVYPVVYLIYTINCKELKETLCTRTVREVEHSQKTSTTTRRNMKNPKVGYYSPMAYNTNTNTLASSLPGPELYKRPSTFTPLAS